jgi:hypothetical protein
MHPTVSLVPLDRPASASSLAAAFHPFRWVETRIGLLVLGVLCLSAFDAGSTLYLISEGMVEEANPLMLKLIERDPWLFALAKQWITGACVLVAACLAHHRAFGFLQGRVILRMAATGYTILALWHVFLISLTRIA